MNRPLRIRLRQGWFPAGSPVMEALGLLSDGAFKLFVWLRLRADRSTGRLAASHADLAASLGKSRRSIVTHLAELRRLGVCRLHPAANQHHPGWIEIREAYWPYERDAPPQASDGTGLDGEARYVDQAARWFAEMPGVDGVFTAIERKTAAGLHREGVPLRDVERALLVGCARWHVTWLNRGRGAPIASFNYFLPVLDEVRELAVPDRYWDHLKMRLPQSAPAKNHPASVRLCKLCTGKRPGRRDEMTLHIPTRRFQVDSKCPLPT